MEDVLVLLVGAVPIAVSVLLGVQGLKVFGVINGDTAPRAALILAAIFTVGVIAIDLFPDAARYVELAFTGFNGAMVAGLFYEYLASPILGAFKSVRVSSEDLNGS